jgi:hypothetical protein
VEQEQDDAHGNDRDQDEERNPKTGMTPAKESEGSPCVPYVVNVE